MKVSAGLGVLVPYEPTISPTLLGQPFKNKGRKTCGLYIVSLKKLKIY